MESVLAVDEDLQKYDAQSKQDQGAGIA